ncbi:hypothetical protein EFB08_12210 [Rufibacter latericius]|uniref:Uncharacterized protein n=1 Tax=Rufibacter latericius TaxID=2487040 RepID=A0A3M9MJ87_9BACT|nr:hypothetical protein EFB08_12210 [Rufibacter latericius]
MVRDSSIGIYKSLNIKVYLCFLSIPFQTCFMKIKPKIERAIHTLLLISESLIEQEAWNLWPDFPVA